MRSLAVLSLFAVTPLLSAGMSVAGKEPGRPVVIIVHGRGLLDSDSTALRNEWRRDLDVGLAGTGIGPLRDGDVRLAWYADALDPARETSCAMSRAEDDKATAGAFVRGFLSGLAISAPDSDRQQFRNVLGDVLYAIDPATRCAAERRVERAIAAARAEGRPAVVLAYSLGAFVAFDYLNRRPAQDSVTVRFVTLGSPLAHPMIRELLLDGASIDRVPRHVASWTNIVDVDDPLAVPLQLTGVTNVDTRDTVSVDPHGIRHYLRDTATGDALARALCAASPAFSPSCASFARGRAQARL